MSLVLPDDTHHGRNYQLLENQKWNKVLWEIPHIIGTDDDRSPVTPDESHAPTYNYVTINFHAARAQARAAILLMKKDPILANMG